MGFSWKGGKKNREHATVSCDDADWIKLGWARAVCAGMRQGGSDEVAKRKNKDTEIQPAIAYSVPSGCVSSSSAKVCSSDGPVTPPPVGDAGAIWSLSDRRRREKKRQEKAVTKGVSVEEDKQSQSAIIVIIYASYGPTEP